MTEISVANSLLQLRTGLLAMPFQYLLFVYCSVEKLMHQRPNPIHFFFQREMARVEKMELCTGNISFIEFSTLHRKDSIVFAPSDQRGGLLFTEILLPIGIDIQIPFLRCRGLKVGNPCSLVDPNKPGRSPNCQG
jgi:hypothetical protein